MNGVLWVSAFSAGATAAVAILSATLNYRSEGRRLTAETARETRQRAFDREHGIVADKRHRYEAFIDAAYGISAFMQHTEGRLIRSGSDAHVPEVPDDLLARFSAGAAGAFLESPDGLAQDIRKLFTSYLESIRLQQEDGAGYVSAAWDMNELDSIRERMRADLLSSSIDD